MPETNVLMTSVGSYLPARVLTNEELSGFVDTSDEWIRQRTGISQRHIVAEGELTSDLGANAAEQALDRINLSASDIDLIIVATTTPDDTFPSTATKLQHRLGAKHAIAFDVQAVCAGFVYALDIADAMLRTGRGRRALVIGAESFSKFSTGMTAVHVCCLVMAPGRLFLNGWMMCQTGGSDHRCCIPMVSIVIFSMLMAGRPAHPRLAMFVWKEIRCSAMRLKNYLPSWMRHLRQQA